MIRYAIAVVVLLVGCSSCWEDAHAQTCPSYTYNLQNGQTADASQVMGNFNTVRNCVNGNVLAKSNNLSDVNNAATSRSNLGLGASAVENLGNNVVDDGSGNLYSRSSLHVQIFTSSGTFTVPSSITGTTVFKITAIGGGGGGGGVSGSNVAAGGGASGAVGIGWFSGLAAAQTMAVTVGAAGGGGTAPSNGSNGSESDVFSPNSTEIMECFGGNGGTGASTTKASAGGLTENCNVTAGASGLTLAGSLQYGGQQAGGVGLGASFSGYGGGNAFGYGGNPVINGAGVVGTIGTGGSGAQEASGSGNGGAGGAGEVIFEWVQ